MVAAAQAALGTIRSTSGSIVGSGTGRETRAGAADQAAGGETYDVLLRGGRTVDGTGNPWFTGDLAIRSDRIAAVGNLRGARARRTIDARGLVVAPGFIDMLGQSEFTVLVDPQVRSKITQGITTELTGEGGSVAPQTSFTIEDLLPGIAEYGISVDWRDYDGYFRRLKAKGSAINFAHLVGATQVRQAVLKSDNRLPNAGELEAMKRHVGRAMEAGVFGLSTSLIYPPATFSDTHELVELSRVASRYGGIYASHIRNEADTIIPALKEAEAIGEQAAIPVEIWHLKCAGRQNWGRMKEVLGEIESARARGIDVTADIYPYPASSTGLAARACRRPPRKGASPGWWRVSRTPSSARASAGRSRLQAAAGRACSTTSADPTACWSWACARRRTRSTRGSGFPR